MLSVNCVSTEFEIKTIYNVQRRGATTCNAVFGRKSEKFIQNSRYEIRFLKQIGVEFHAIKSIIFAFIPREWGHLTLPIPLTISSTPDVSDYCPRTISGPRQYHIEIESVTSFNNRNNIVVFIVLHKYRI